MLFSGSDIPSVIRRCMTGILSGKETVTDGVGLPMSLDAVRAAPANLTDDVLDQVELALFAWGMGAIDYQGVNVAIANYLERDHVLEANPLAQGWAAHARNAWLSAMRWKLFYLYDVHELRLTALSLGLKRQTGQGSRLAIGQAMADRSFHGGERDLFLEMTAHPVYGPKFRSLVDKVRVVRARGEECELDPDRLRDELSVSITQYKLMAAAKAKSAQKLRFVATYNNLNLTDLSQSLLLRGMGYYLAARPLVGKLHAANRAKAAMDGGVQQIIRYYTAEDRARLVESGDGWSVREVPLDLAFHQDADGTSDDSEAAA